MVRLFSLPLVVLHYDLVDTGGGRVAHDALVQEKLKPLGIQRLTPTALAVPQESNETARAAATRLWKGVAQLTHGKLAQRDRFYLHYGSGDAITTVVEVLVAGQTSLTEDPTLDALVKPGKPAKG